MSVANRRALLGGIAAAAAVPVPVPAVQAPSPGAGLLEACDDELSTFERCLARITRLHG
jgi:hypothetical protein